MRKKKQRFTNCILYCTILTNIVVEYISLFILAIFISDWKILAADTHSPAVITDLKGCLLDNGVLAHHKTAMHFAGSILPTVFDESGVTPSPASALMQMVYACNSQASLFRSDRKKLIQLEIDALQKQLNQLNDAVNGKTPTVFPNHRKKDDFPRIYDHIATEIKQSEDKNARVWQQASISHAKLGFQLAKQHIHKPVDESDREISKDVEYTAAKTIFAYKQMNSDNFIFPYILSHYGNWSNPANICEAIHSFLTSRGLNDTISYNDNLKEAKPQIIQSLEKGMPVVVETKLGGQNKQYLCLGGLLHINGSSSTNIIAIVAQETDLQEYNISGKPLVVTANDLRCAYLIQWTQLLPILKGYYIFASVQDNVGIKH